MKQSRKSRNGKAKASANGQPKGVAESVAIPQAAARGAPVERIGRWPIGKLLPYAANPKTHPPAHVDLIARSMARFGQTQIVLVDEGGEIIAGHGRVLAAQSLGWTELVVGEAVGWTEDEKRAYRIADNQLGSELLAPWDMALLKPELASLSMGGFDMAVLGFDNHQLRQFLAGQAGDADAEATPDLSPTPAVRTGDLWLLDEHRLLCGDCTKAEDVARLLGEAKPHLMVTDPPYGVNYRPAWRNEALGEGNRSVGTVANDDRADWREAWKLFYGGVAYIWHAGTKAGIVADSLNACGFEIRTQIIWAKQHFAISRGHYHVQHEPCWYAVRDQSTGHWSGDRTQTTLWQINNGLSQGGPRKTEDELTGLGAQKPVECMRRPIENNSVAGDAIYDPFVGSGTTIIAAEMAARRCMAMEIDPRYAQVSVERWQNFTAKKAILDGDGRDFDTIKAERLPAAGRLQPVDRGSVSGNPGANGKRRAAVGAEGKGRRPDVDGPSRAGIGEDHAAE